ncbi:MAG: hypothetical protein WAR39_00030 [Prevotella sp.]
MSLDTVLQIGKAFRQSEDSLKYFKYIEPCPADNKGNYPLCITIPVNDDFSFNWNEIKITKQNKRDKLYYLKFKTSDSDTSAPKYIFGDIFYYRKRTIDKKGDLKSVQERGNYIIDKSDAFKNAENVRQSFISSIINPNSDKLSKQEKELLALLNENITQEESSSDEKVEYFLEKNDILKFWKSFQLNKDKIENCLIYAPVITQHNINNLNLIKENYSKYLFENKETKKIFKGKDDFDKLSDEEKEKLNKYADHSVYIYFDFQGKSWFENEYVFDIISQKLNNEQTEKQKDGLIVPTKYIYRTLCSGAKKNDIQFPLFDFQNSYKSFGFKDDEEFKNFLYAGPILEKPIQWLYGTSIGMYVFPVVIEGENISPKDYEKFFFDKKDETKLVHEPLFSFFEKDGAEKFTRFDFVFADSSGKTTKDLIEISGIEKSKLREIKKRIEDKEKEIAEEKQQMSGWKDTPTMRIEWSFSNLLGRAEIETSDGKIRVVFKSKNKKNETYPPYKSHLMKVLPLIYTDNYCNDKILLPNSIQRIEFSVRSGDESGNYSLLKYDLKLLLGIQNNINDKYMEITETKSYQIGVKLGKLSKPLKNEIKPFEKTYVGLLSRRTSTKNDCISFSNDICEKLTMHEKVWKAMAAEVCNELVSLPNAEYDKEKFAIGFFEGYFKYEAGDKKKDFYSRLEKLLADYESNPDLSNETQLLTNFLSELNNNQN